MRCRAATGGRGGTSRYALGPALQEVAGSIPARSTYESSANAGLSHSGQATETGGGSTGGSILLRVGLRDDVFELVDKGREVGGRGRPCGLVGRLEGEFGLLGTEVVEARMGRQSCLGAFG